MNTRTETLHITGMSCGHCVRAVRDTLGKLEGVEVDDVQIGSAQVRYDADRVTVEQMAEALDAEGYPLAS